ncbi:carbohydrate ABC transporter permease, partial [Streptococcus pneumoniae]
MIFSKNTKKSNRDKETFVDYLFIFILIIITLLMLYPLWWVVM